MLNMMVKTCSVVGKIVSNWSNKFIKSSAILLIFQLTGCSTSVRIKLTLADG